MGRKRRERKTVFAGVTGRPTDFSLQLRPHDTMMQITSMWHGRVGLRTEGHDITALRCLQRYP